LPLTIPSYSHPIGKLLRLPLRLVPTDTVVPVFTGELRGGKWLTTSATHGCWLGTYEREKQRAFAAAVEPTMTVFDIGANVGFYTLIASRLVGPRGRVVAFEPLPRNVDYLRRHVSMNAASNVTVIEAAVAERGGTGMLKEGSGPAEGALSSCGDVMVRLVALDLLTDLPAPDVMKIDVEGAEFEVLRGAAATLRTHRPTIFLATHGVRPNRDCIGMLLSYGYRLANIGNMADELIARV